MYCIESCTYVVYLCTCQLVRSQEDTLQYALNGYSFVPKTCQLNTSGVERSQKVQHLNFIRANSYTLLNVLYTIYVTNKVHVTNKPNLFLLKNNHIQRNYQDKTITSRA